jgi:hypothetical protein
MRTRWAEGTHRPRLRPVLRYNAHKGSSVPLSSSDYPSVALLEPDSLRPIVGCCEAISIVIGLRGRASNSWTVARGRTMGQRSKCMRWEQIWKHERIRRSVSVRRRYETREA